MTFLNALVIGHTFALHFGEMLEYRKYQPYLPLPLFLRTRILKNEVDRI